MEFYEVVRQDGTSKRKAPGSSPQCIDATYYGHYSNTNHARPNDSNESSQATWSAATNAT